MTRRVFNYGGGMHSPTALTAFLRDALDGDVADGMVVSAGGGMSVTVGAGTARVGRDPSYDINISGTESVDVGAASPSNPMNALIVAYVDRDVAGDESVTDNTNDVFKLKAVSGAAAASPADPSTSAIQAAIGAANPYIILARVNKRAGATSVLASDITDLRTLVTIKAGRINTPGIIADGLINSGHLGNNIIQSRHFTTEARLDYSYDEYDTGRKWLDGKTIYCKTVDFGLLPNNQLKQFAHGIANIDRVVHVETHATDARSPMIWINIPYYNPGTATMGSFRVTRDAIFLQTTVDRTGVSMTVTIYYTKM